MPPLIAVAVNVTIVPAQTVSLGSTSIISDTGVVANTVTRIESLSEGQPPNVSVM
jgi:hypothetical protein